MFRVVYVYTGDKIDKYYYMLQISIKSLLVHSPSIGVTIVTNKQTEQFIMQFGNETFRRDTVSFISVDLPQGVGSVEASRYLKTNLRALLSGDFLFIDCDTVICENISNAIFPGSVCMVLDNHARISELGKSGEILRERAQNRGLDISTCELYFNSGVMMVKDDKKAHEFFDLWHAEWKRTKKEGMYQDQFALNFVNSRTNTITEIEGKWNCQVISNPYSLKHLATAKIVHYYNTQEDGIYLLNDRDILMKGCDSEEVKQIIENPRVAFKPTYTFAAHSETMSLLSSYHYKMLEKTSCRFKRCFFITEKILATISKRFHRKSDTK